jgi:hypothetical protein
MPSLAPVITTTLLLTSTYPLAPWMPITAVSEPVLRQSRDVFTNRTLSQSPFRGRGAVVEVHQEPAAPWAKCTSRLA